MSSQFLATLSSERYCIKLTTPDILRIVLESYLFYANLFHKGLENSTESKEFTPARDVTFGGFCCIKATIYEKVVRRSAQKMSQMRQMCKNRKIFYGGGGLLRF